MLGSRRLLILAPVLTVLLASPAAGQWMMHPPPARSSYWWTLTDGISPEELRAALQSREASRERLQRAIEAGEYPPAWTHQPSPSKDRVATVSLFIDGRRDPDLIPMWDAFSTFSRRVSDPESSSERKAREGLPTYGLSDASVEEILTVAVDAERRRKEVQISIHDRQMEFARRVVGPLEQRQGKERGAEVIQRQDFAQLASMSGLPASRVTDLYRIWVQDPFAEEATRALELLRGSLAEAEWEGFRRYLLDEVAPSISYNSFGARPER